MNERLDKVIEMLKKNDELNYDHRKTVNKVRDYNRLHKKEITNFKRRRKYEEEKIANLLKEIKEEQKMETLSGVEVSKEWLDEIIRNAWYHELNKENSSDYKVYSLTINDYIQHSLEKTFKQEDIDRIIKLAIEEWKKDLESEE